MTPRFSATKGSRSVFIAACTASNSAAPGPFTHSPRMAVVARPALPTTPRIRGSDRSDPIDQREQGTKALDPPCISGLLMDVPPVMRISPQLPGCAEIVGWYAGDDGRPPVRVEPEQLSPPPDVGAVVRDEDRNVALDLDRSRVTGLAPSLHCSRTRTAPACAAGSSGAAARPSGDG